MRERKLIQPIMQRPPQTASRDTFQDIDQPLVSIISFCKDRASTIRRSIDSVLSQSYRNIEFVVQDGASTDGTLEILREYNDPRIKIVSEKDSGPAEAFWKVMNRCQGEIIGTCLSDEELLPGAIEKAVECFRAEPQLGAITCDGYVTDTDGKIINEFNAGEFNFVDYLFGWYCPFWPGSFFRRQALIDVGLEYHDWTIECLEFETWCRLATQHEVKHIPIRMSKYAVHATQLSNTEQYFHEHFDNRALVIRKMFSDTGFFGNDDIKLNGCLYNQLYLLYNHVQAYKLADQAKVLSKRMEQLKRSISPLERINYIEYFNFLGNNFGRNSLVNETHIFRRISSIWVRGALSIPANVRQRIPVVVKRGLRSALTLAMFLAFNAKYSMLFLGRMFYRLLPSRPDDERQASEEFLKNTAHEAAERYSAIGRRIWFLGASSIPAVLRRRIPVVAKNGLRRALVLAKSLASSVECSLKFTFHSLYLLLPQRNATVEEPYSPEFSKKVYHDAAQIYYARGQIDQALQMWQRAEGLNDPMIDGLACQAMLMSPTATYEGLMKAQQRWADRYAIPDPALASHIWKPYDGKRRIRVGYFCSFLDSDTIRFIAVPVIRESDRQKFEFFAYSPSPVPSDIASVFDCVRVTGAMPDDEFVELVRADEIDIFVELSGFSPLNRFSAMASRCAPIQVSYLNHTGTSCVPNVDYILADAVSVLPEEDRFFSEQVWRLPGSFLSYNYDASKLPPVAPSPRLTKGYVTFGCFGSGGKINTQLIALWAAIMNRAPNSQMFIRNGQLSKQDNCDYMRAHFRRHGIGADRLRLLGGTDRQTILKCYDDVDISLDTWPYCGGNTIAEPICQGVPVVTLKSNRFSGRYGASLIAVAGCEDLIAESPEQYIDIAVALSQDSERLDYYRGNLRSMAREHGLTDAAKFAEKLDAAYLKMMKQRWR